MRDGWIETKLADAVEVLDRFRKPVNSTERQGRQGSIPYYGANGQAGWIDDSIFNEELVLLGEDAIDFADPTARKAYLISGPSWVNNHAHVLRAKPEKVYSYFLAESLNKVDYSQYVSFGTRSKLTQGSMNGIKVLLPPLPEQRRIVDLLSSIDTYIESIQLKLLCAVESRNAMLHELLTADGDDWIETTLGDVVTVVNGGTPSTKNEKYWGGEVLWVTTTELTAFDGQRIDSSKRTITQDGLNSGPARMVRQGTTLVGTTATIGTCAIAACNLTFNQQISGLIPDSNQLQDEYLFYWIQLIKPVLEGLSAGTSFKRISTSVLKTISIKYPPLPEQVKIVDFIESLDEVVSECKGVMLEAKDLRSALLADLLSGKHEIPASYDKFIGAA
jgi:type I restriction enzyme S subunit